MLLESVLEVPKFQFCSEYMYCFFTHLFHYPANPEHVEWDIVIHVLVWLQEAFHFPLNNCMTFALGAKLEFMEIVSFFARKESYCHAQQWPSLSKSCYLAQGVLPEIMHMQGHWRSLTYEMYVCSFKQVVSKHLLVPHPWVG